MRHVELREDGIRLGQLLKLAGFVDAGSDVRPLLAEGAVTVDGRPETRRGRQLDKGNVVAVRGVQVRLV
jgi:ribosome-associated protein